MSRFVARTRELALLHGARERVQKTIGTPQPGACLFVRGRRRVGKSRLIEVFLEQSQSRSLYFTASQQGERELGLFLAELADSSLATASGIEHVAASRWDGALTLLASSLPSNDVSVVIIDEFPYLVAGDASIEGTFQKHWDRYLSHKPVLLILVGSDVAAMEALNTPGRPLFQRGQELVVSPLSPREVADIIQPATPADAFDAYLLTGGMPMICDEWPTGDSATSYLEKIVSEPSSMFVNGALRSLNAEFPSDALARDVLTHIGSGEMTFSTIARASGGLQATSLARALNVLIPRKIVTKVTPLSTRPSREARYAITDTYLQFWLRFIGPHLAEIDRGRGDRTFNRLKDQWSSWRGRAIEPIVRESLLRLLPHRGIDASEVGGYWTRTNSPEVDLIGADRGPVARSIGFAGSIKWREIALFEQSDFLQLAADAMLVPGVNAATPLLVVSRTGVRARGHALALGPADLLNAWN